MRADDRRPQRLIAAFQELGYCTDCWVNLNEEDHEPYCETLLEEESP